MENLQLHFVLVDDHSMVQEGFKSVIQNTFANAKFSLFSSVADTLKADLIEDHSILITDIDLGQEQNGFDLIRIIKDQGLECKVIVLSMYEQAVYLHKAKELSVDGYINKREASKVMVEAIEQVINGNSYFSGEIQEKMFVEDDEFEIYEKLYPKEREVFLRLAVGMPVKKIARELDVSVKTIHSHRLNLYGKFGYTSSFGFTKYAMRNGIIKKDDLC